MPISIGLMKTHTPKPARKAKARILILDEATSALDVITQSEILQLFGRLNRETGMSILYISHDLASMAELCHRSVILCPAESPSIRELRVDSMAISSSYWTAPTADPVAN